MSCMKTDVTLSERFRLNLKAEPTTLFSEKKTARRGIEYSARLAKHAEIRRDQEG